VKPNSQGKKFCLGELLNHPPIGYVRAADGDYQMDPDEQVQSAVRLIFEVFEREGSLHGLLRRLTTYTRRRGTLSGALASAISQICITEVLPRPVGRSQEDGVSSPPWTIRSYNACCQGNGGFPVSA
jgi:hypothetical protein